MPRFRNFKDDLLCHSAWELFLATLLACALALADLLRQYSTPVLLYVFMILITLICGLVQLLRGRRFRLTHTEAARAEKRKEIKDRLFYDQTKKYGICMALCFAAILWCLTENVLSQYPASSAASLYVLFYWFLNCLLRCVFSLRYERQQHREFLTAHPEKK